MELTKEEVVRHLEQAEQAYVVQQVHKLEQHISAIQENFDVFSNSDTSVYIRYYRLYMRFLGLFKEVDVSAMKTYLEALEAEGIVEASDYECICSYYKQCPQEIYEKALMAFSYNENLHLHYALKLNEERRFGEAIEVLHYVLECYPESTEVRFLLSEIQREYLDDLCISEEEVPVNKLLYLASATHNISVLKGLNLDPRLTQAEQYHTQIQLAIWQNRSVEVRDQWRAEWKHLKLADRTRILLADYAKAFMIYDMVAEVLVYPETPEFPEENYSDFSAYKSYMAALVNAGWQRAQHQYYLIGKSCYFYSNDLKKMAYCLQQGLTLNPKNPLLIELKGKFFFYQGDYQEAAKAFHAAFNNGLSATDYLQTLMDLNDRVRNNEGILQVVNQFHLRHWPNAKSTCFKGFALAKLGHDAQALAVLNEGIEGYNQNSFHAWMYYWRAILHKRNKNYDLFFQDIEREVQFYKEGSSDYCNSMNLSMEVLFEMADYEKSYNYASYCHEQGKLDPELYPVLQWLCFYNFKENPEGVRAASEGDLVPNPQTFIDYRNNGLVYWIIGNETAAAESLVLAAQNASDAGVYYKLAFIAARAAFDNTLSLNIYDELKARVPEDRTWEVDYPYPDLLLKANRYKEATAAQINLIASYPYRAFFDFPKDINYLAGALKRSAKEAGNLKDYIRYSAMFLSKESPWEIDLKEHQEITEDFYKEELFLRHNLLQTASHLEEPLEELETSTLENIKSHFITTYFA